MTLLRVRKEATLALTLGKQFFHGQLASVHFLTEQELREAWQVFRQCGDKEWSFADCTSKVIVEKLGLATAFAFDRHFRQFGTFQVVP